MKFRTADYLAQELAKAGAPAGVVADARNGYYDDYRSELDFPIGQLVSNCRRLGLYELAHRAENGDFDGTKEEADAWARTPEGRSAITSLGDVHDR